MIRRQHAPLFGGADAEATEDADPRVGLVNLADIMLVLAVAIMVSLLTHFGSSSTAVQIDESALEAISDEESSVSASDVESGDAQYVEAGTVYRDVETGDLYVVTQ